MRIVVDDRWRVDATACLDVPLSASAVWGQMRDFQRFLTLDPLHRRVRVAGAALSARGAGPSANCRTRESRSALA